MIPYRDIRTLSLDVGNTLISIDFDHVAAGLAAHGLDISPETLRRTEAAARPKLSRHFATPKPDRPDPFLLYLQTVLAHLPEPGVDDPAALTARVAPTLYGDRSSQLWRSVMPRVRESLDRFVRLGLRLVVTSNSDGTVEETLSKAGLRDAFTAVIDSAVVGFDKPDVRIFEHALEAAGGEASSTLHVGDLYDADVIGARGAGCHALLLDPYGDWTDVDCDCLPDLWALADRLDSARRAT